MNVAFLNLPWWEKGTEVDSTQFILRNGVRAGSRWPFTRNASFRPDEFKFGSYLPYPFFLGSAAAWVKRECPELNVVLRDSIARGESYATFNEFWTAFKPDAVILETGAASWEHDKKYLTLMRGSNPGIRIAVAGPPARDLAKTTEPGVVDAWLLGEYEKNAVKFINGASGVLEFDLITKAEFPAMPFPMFDDDVALNYWDSNPRGQLAPHLQLISSRGCPFHCNFCSWVHTMSADDPNGDQPHPVRFHSAQWIEDFIRKFLEKHPETKSVYFDDDIANASSRHVRNISEVMRKIGLPWSAMCRADTIGRDSWQLMKDSGCFGVKIGFESGSQEVIDNIIHKGLNLKKAEETCRWLRSIGMTVHTTWTIGSPGETAAQQQETLDAIKRFYAEGVHDTHQLSGTAEIPGTPLANVAHNDPNYVSSRDGNKKLAGMKAS